jgi:hypothetical protein
MLHHAGAKDNRRYSSYSFLTLALDGDQMSASRPGRALPLEKDPQYPLDRRLGRPQSWFGHRDYRESPFPLPGIEPWLPDHPVFSQTLYWLSYPSSVYHICWFISAALNKHVPQYLYYCCLCFHSVALYVVTNVLEEVATNIFRAKLSMDGMWKGYAGRKDQAKENKTIGQSESCMGR